MKELKYKYDIKNLDNILSRLIGDNIQNEIPIGELYKDYLNWLKHIIFLNELDIIGERLTKLYYVCCKRDKINFILTLHLIEKPVFKLSDILKNLNSDNPLPFFNESIIPPNITRNQKVDFYRYTSSDEFYNNQQENFYQRFTNKIK